MKFAEYWFELKHYLVVGQEGLNFNNLHRGIIVTRKLDLISVVNYLLFIYLFFHLTNLFESLLLSLTATLETRELICILVIGVLLSLNLVRPERLCSCSEAFRYSADGLQTCSEKPGQLWMSAYLGAHWAWNCFLDKVQTFFFFFCENISHLFLKAFL